MTHIVPDQDVLDVFIEESRERLSEMEVGLLDIDRFGESSDPEMLNSVFRSAHSIKAGASLLRIRSVERLAHYLEHALGRVRSGHISADSDLVTAMLEGLDALRDLIDAAPNCTRVDVSDEVLCLREALGRAECRAPSATIDS
ncbi:Hpt domain-containing protein [Desulfobaculum bizertense]|uniref:Two-component system, chemotaxis family, sensor kinase CheA n=1 Tax=Desulfobaculum bizertense DSM 18034 TaxID=1121442 RepID=A0A1T4WLQ2_9BACT|nr:Hpt domain-containing protein [Desulfobaculum bizertense]UIJ37055.1 Hpt domain-containing protein [Desulfobaculum bizertense]SKA78263.1 two-component system, chemotaxis family, sensor kinase CheA [Desulfobaculum bizertense DSM 18034]